LPVEVRVEPQLLGTGGGIRNVLEFFEDQHFVVINGDILCDVPLRELYEQHLSSGATVSLVMHDWRRSITWQWTLTATFRLR